MLNDESRTSFYESKGLNNESRTLNDEATAKNDDTSALSGGSGTRKRTGSGVEHGVPSGHYATLAQFWRDYASEKGIREGHAGK